MYVDEDGEVDCGHGDEAFCEACEGCSECSNCYCDEDDESLEDQMDADFEMEFRINGYC